MSKRELQQYTNAVRNNQNDICFLVYNFCRALEIKAKLQRIGIKTEKSIEILWQQIQPVQEKIQVLGKCASVEEARAKIKEKRRLA